jgi:hypothetical protein
MARKSSPRHAIPQWFVSAAHRRPPESRSDQPQRPHGIAHARMVGAPTTACGLRAIGWPYFWELAFDSADENACHECAMVAGIKAGPHAFGRVAAPAAKG